MITRSQKKKLENVTVVRNRFVQIPIDLVIDIFGRLPVKSLSGFLLVSKLWETTIRNGDFFTSRVLVAFIDIDRQRQLQDWYLFSPSSSSTSFVSCGTFPLPNPEREYNAHYVNGLISLGYGKEHQFITNPSTGKTINLPSVKVRAIVNEQEKLLIHGHGNRPKSTQHQVHTLGAKQKPWRMIECNIPHRCLSDGHVYINGVVYYVAYTSADLSQLSLMRFDLKSEKLDLLTSLSPDIGARHRHDSITLINYQGKVALPAKTSTYTYEVWIMDQDAETRVWSKKIFSIERCEDLIQLSLHITGTTHTGEFILAPRHYCEGFHVIHYNPDTNSFRNIKVEVNEDYEFKRRCTRAIVFSDYVENVRLL
ncbi:unnamed protein product [Arabis nemorensis]|uniref:F-box domain-containing protein n=1 Tax=Arabis nemorensis TaxID=586526 RepID=A0A565CLP4_9BRAS|nr:unnamed protein product [Arabis nemorensis]